MELKRSICKGCYRVLLPGETARVRLKKKPQRHMRWTCLHCGSWKVFNTKKGYEVWSEKMDSLGEKANENNK